MKLLFIFKIVLKSIVPIQNYVPTVSIIGTHILIEILGKHFLKF